MASVGAENFNIVSQVKAAAEQVQTLDREGLDGVALRLMGVKGEPFQLQCEADLVLQNPGAIAGKRATYKSLQGTVVTVVMDTGEQRTGIAIIRATEIRFEDVVAGVGGLAGSSATHLAFVTLECIDTSIT